MLRYKHGPDKCDPDCDDRTKCQDTGPGHLLCGFCLEHGVPRHVCLCPHKPEGCEQYGHFSVQGVWYHHNKDDEYKVEVCHG